LSLTLRLAYVRELTNHPIGRGPWVDELAYYLRAREILAGGWLPTRPFYQDPLFPYFLSVLMRILGTDVVTLRFALATLGALTPLTVMWAGRVGLGRAEGIVAGVITAIYGPLIFADGLLEKEGFAALVAALALTATVLGIGRGRRVAWAALSGLAWGSLVLLRANALVIGLLGAAWWWLEGKTGAERRLRFARAFLFSLGFALAMLPAILINLVVSRPTELLLTTWQGGANFYIGNGPEANGTYVPLKFVTAHPAYEADDFAAEARRRAGRWLSPGGVSHFWYVEGLRHWREAPEASVRLLVRKLGLLAHDFEIGDSHDLRVIQLIAAPRLSWGVLSFGLVAPLAILGLGRSPRTPFWWFLVLSSAAGLLSIGLFFVVGRYRIPWIPGLALLAAYGFVDLVRLVSCRQWKSLAMRVAFLAVPAGALAWRPLADPAPRRWNHAQINLALAYAGEGRLEEAIDALDDARAMDPALATKVASFLEKGSLHDRVAALVGEAMKRRPEAGSSVHRARWLRQLPETRSESRRLLEELLRVQPRDPRVRREWGAWWLGQHDNPSARRVAGEHLATAVTGPTGDASAAILLALLTSDPRLLAKPAGLAAHSISPRLRLAKAILAERRTGAVRPQF
jgi:hypothetical protein